MSRADPQVNVRIPADLKARLESAAAASGRSFTAEVMQRLKDSFDIGEALENAEAQSSADRVWAATALFAVDAGARVEGGVRKLAGSFLRTERDRQAAQELVDQLSAAITKAQSTKKKTRVR